jgi:hypothetical protein
MTIQLVKVYEAKCDGCGKCQYSHVKDDIVTGIVGRASEHTETAGGWGGDWFACSRECILKAILAILDRRD